MRAPYILYKRGAGKKRPTYYVGFWSEAHQDYRDRQSVQRIIDSMGERAAYLNATSRAAADAAVQMWLAAGSPKRQGETWLSYLLAFWGRDGEYAVRLRSAGKRITNAYADNNKWDLARFVEPYLAKRKLSGLTLSQVDARFIEDMLLAIQKECGASGRRLNQIRQAISVAMKEAKRLGKIARNPVTDVMKFREKRKPRKILTRVEATNLLSKLKTGDRRVFVANLLGATTGMRLGECIGLTIDRLHEETVKLDDGSSRTYHWIELDAEASNWTEADRHHGAKSGSIGEVPVPATTAELLKRLHGENPWRNEWVFWGGHKHRPMTARDIWSGYNDACEQIGIETEERKARKLGFHAWRHFYVSVMRSLSDARSVQAVVRHANEATTKIYSHLTDEQRREITDAAGGVIQYQESGL